jgi:type I restriction enzyme S subunit
MGSEWREGPLSALADLTGGFAFKSDDYAPSGRFVLRTLNIGDDGSISRDEAVYLPEALCPLYERFELRAHDTLFVMVGATLGKVGYVRATDLPALLNQNMWRIRAKTGVGDPRFVQYAFRHAVKGSLRGASGSAREFVKRDDFRNLPIKAPPFAEQEAIGEMLGALDDKIELNRRMSQTLEAMARALFKSWFVDFDPVRAKAEGRDTGLRERLSGLFPDSLDDSELGEIPKGWAASRIGDVACRIVERVQDAAVWQDEPLIDLSRMPQRSIALTDWGLGAEMAGSITRFRATDTLFGAIRPYFHKVGIAPMDGVTNVSVFVLRARREKDWPFVALLCSMSATVDYATRVARGTKMPVVSWPDFENCSIPLPPSGTREAFDRVVGPLLDRIAANAHESHSLAAAQNTLLPRLVSGELSLHDAERFVGDGD